MTFSDSPDVPEDFLAIPLKDGGVWIRLDRTNKGRVMCCLCFDWCTHDQLNPTDDGRVEDVCIPCAKKEAEDLARRRAGN